MKLNIYLAGVGGRGLMYLKEWLEATMGNSLIAQNIVGCETHGLAQRGGSTYAHSRVGKEIYSVTMPKYSADFYISLELLEAVRLKNIVYSNPTKTILITDTIIIPTMRMLGEGLIEIPPGLLIVKGENFSPKKDIEDALKKCCKEYHGIPAMRLSEKHFGQTLYSNIIVFGLASRLMSLSKEKTLEAVNEVCASHNMKKETIVRNLEAFELGYSF